MTRKISGILFFVITALSADAAFDWTPVGDFTWGTTSSFTEGVGLNVQSLEDPAGTPAIDGLTTSAFSYTGSEYIGGGYTFSFKMSDFETTNTGSILFISIFNPTSNVLVDPSKCFVFEVNIETDGSASYYDPRWGFGNTTENPATESVAAGSTFEWGVDNTITLTYHIDGTELTVDVTYLEAESGALKTFTSATYILDDDLTSLVQMVGFSSTTGAYDCTGDMTITDFAVPEPAEWAAIFSAAALALAVWRRRK